MAKTSLPTITNLQTLRRRVATESSLKEIRGDYSRLRSAMQKRVKRAQAAGYLEHGVAIPTLKEIGSDSSALAYEYSRLSKLLQSAYGSVGGIREAAEKRVATFQDLGYDFVTEENELQFGRFMGYMVKKYSEDTPDGKKLMLDSDIIVEGFDYVAERTKSQNHATISRLFNDYLREEGLL